MIITTIELPTGYLIQMKLPPLRRRNYEPHIEREGYHYTNEKEWEQRFEKYMKESKNPSYERN